MQSFNNIWIFGVNETTQKGRCEGGQTAHTARYTQPFARKVIDSLSACETWSRIVNLLNKEVEAALPAEEPEDADMPGGGCEDGGRGRGHATRE